MTQVDTNPHVESQIGPHWSPYPCGSVDGRNPAPPKKPWFLMIPLQIPTNHGFPMVSMWCEMDFVHPQYVPPKSSNLAQFADAEAGPRERRGQGAGALSGALRIFARNQGYRNRFGGFPAERRKRRTTQLDALDFHFFCGVIEIQLSLPVAPEGSRRFHRVECWLWANMGVAHNLGSRMRCPNGGDSAV